MAFKKGESGNPSGRPAGTNNKVSNKLRGTITAFLSDNFQKLKDDFGTMPAKDRAKLYCDLLQYGLPKLQAMSMDLSFDRLTEEELNEIIQTLINKSNEKRLQHSAN